MEFAIPLETIRQAPQRSRRRQAFPTPPGMAYAIYIGRVGALAVALGVGAGVAGYGGTAGADDTAGATTNSDSGHNSGPAGAIDTDTRVEVAGQTVADPPASNPASPTLNWPGLHLPRVIVRGSRGAFPGAGQSGAPTPAPKADSTPAPQPDSTPGPEVSGQQPPIDAFEGTPIDLPATAAPQDTPAPGRSQRFNTPALGSAESAATAASPEQSRQQPSQITDEISTRVGRVGDDATAVTAAITETLTTAGTSVSTSAASQGDNFSGLQLANSTALTTESAPPVDPITQVVSVLLAFFGLNPNATNNPVPAPPPQTLLGVLELIRREIEVILFNQTPTLAYDPTENSLLKDGRVEGDLNPFDPDSATLTYTATDPARGSVVVNPDGTFTYTPDAGFTGEDTFDVTVSDADNGFHIHGPSGMLHLVTFGLVGDSGDTYTQHVTVNTQPVTVNEGLPAGIARTVILSGLNEPMDFLFLPDGPALPDGPGEGRILIAEKAGAILVYDRLTTGQLQNEPLITLPVSTGGERGITGFALDPQYMDNGYIYVANTATDNYDQVSRLTVTDPSADVLTVDPNSVVVLLKADQPANDSHHGGGLDFGPDGKLYWALGDNSDPSNAQNLSTVYGKILRLDPYHLNPDGTATAPDDNPFVKTDDANPYIYAYGFRNPFRMTFTPDGKLLVGDVGQASWEELNIVTAGGNYGWPLAEGVCPGAGVCAQVSDFGSFVNPIYAYPHPTDGPLSGTGSITSVLVYTAPLLGESYQNKVFIADFTLGWIEVLTCTSDYSSCGSETLFDNQAGTTVKLAQEADGDIYQLTIYPGQLSRIAPSGV